MRKYNLSILIPAILLSLISCVVLLSTQISDSFSLSINNIFVKQILFVIIGLGVYFLVSSFDYTLLKFRPLLASFYIFTILLLIAAIIFGQEINGAKRWINIGGIPLQPSEIAKITVILVTAYIFTLKEKYNEWILLIGSFLTILPIAFLIYIEPHGSMAIIVLTMWFLTAFASMRDQLRNILLILSAGLIFVGLFFLTAFSNAAYLILTGIGIVIAIFSFFTRDNWKIPFAIAVALALFVGGVGSVLWNNVLGDYQKARILAFQNPDEDSDTTRFNVNQSIIAIGSGGLFGKGFANGTQSRLQFLPFHQTDFIFASFAEEYGLIGSFILLFLYFILLVSIFSFGLKFRGYEFEKIIVIMIGLKILIEITINLGTNLGLSPATGIPLPLMSAGGTITIMTFFSLGLIQSIIARVNSHEIYKLKD